LGLEGIDESLRAYAAATSPKKTKPTPPTSNQDSEEEEDEYNDEEDDEEAGKGEKLRAEQAKELRGKRVLVLKKPILLKTLTQWKITKVRAGNHYVLAVSSTGKVFSWGRNTNGQLGIGHTQDTSVPTPIESLQQHFCVEISTGFAHVVGIFASVPQFNKVFSWGRGRNGCLGLGGTKDEMLPREVTFFCGLNATKVAAGSDHSLVLCSCGSQTCVYAFGGNTFGQLGINSTSDHFEMPHFLDELGDNIASIGAGARYSAALTVLGELFTWGDGMYGKTNQPTSRTTIVPWRVDTFADHFVTQVSIGQHHSLGVMRDSCKGINRWRQFPLNDIIVPFLHMDERKVEDYYSMTCESSHIQLSHTFFSIHLTCETCEMKDPICRVCIRRCHQGHVLKPTVRGASKTSCVCGRKQDRKKCLAVIPEPIPEEE
jgi:alpha-tubulin suppressor-like RCC1 family protein